MERCGYGIALSERVQNRVVSDSMYRWLISATPEMAETKLASHERYCLICAAVARGAQS